MPPINPTRLMAELHHLRTFGTVGTGVVRPSLSPVDMASRGGLRERMSAAGLDARIDGVGNVIRSCGKLHRLRRKEEIARNRKRAGRDGEQRRSESTAR